MSAVREILAWRPRADMPGFAACEMDKQRQREYLEPERFAARNGQATHAGEELYGNRN